MKKLINIFCLMGVLLLVTTNSYSQQRDVLVQLSSSIGDELNLMERNYYGLYSNFEGFEKAVFYKRSKNTSVTKISYKNNIGENKDTVIIGNSNSLGNLRAHIRRIDVVREEYFDNSKLMTITTKVGKTFTGKLLDVKLNKLFMAADLEDLNNSYLINNYRVFKRDNIESVFIKGKDSNILKNVGKGFLIGGGIGASVGYSAGKDGGIGGGKGTAAFVGGIFFGAIGGVFGLINTLTSAYPEELIIIKTDADYNRLKQYLVTYDKLE